MAGRIIALLVVAVAAAEAQSCGTGRFYGKEPGSPPESYTLCADGVLHRMTCRTGETFDFKGEVCIRAPHCPVDETDTVLFPHEEFCNKFYQCSLGVLTVQTCPRGTEYNPDRWACDWPKPGGCMSMTTTSTTPEPTTPVPTEAPTTVEPKICPQNSTNISILPHPTDCDKFYICFGGVETEYSCSEGQEFNPNTQACEVPQPGGCMSNFAASVCLMATNGISMVAHPTRCDKFFLCMNGKDIEYTCGIGKEFNPKISKCEPTTEDGCTANRKPTKMYSSYQVKQRPQSRHINKPISLRN